MTSGLLDHRARCQVFFRQQRFWLRVICLIFQNAEPLSHGEPFSEAEAVLSRFTNASPSGGPIKKRPTPDCPILVDVMRNAIIMWV